MGRPERARREVRTRLDHKDAHSLLVRQQAKRGTLSLEAPALDHFPRFTGAPDPRITIGHLLSHRSGLVDSAAEGRAPRPRRLTRRTRWG